MHCPVCGSAQLVPNKELSCCLGCSHIFQSDLTIGVKYDAAYLRKYDSHPRREMSFLRLGFIKAFARGGKLLDVGYGKGDFVKLAAENGFDAFGSDVHGLPFGIPEVPLVSQAHW